MWKKMLSTILAFIVLANCTIVSEASIAGQGSQEADAWYEASRDIPADEEAVRRNRVVFEYLNDYYEQYPEEELIIEFLTEKQQNEIQTKVDELIADCNSDTEKVQAIYDWIIENLIYTGYGTPPAIYPYDVYENGVTNCYGYSLLMSTMLKMAGITSVVGCGWHLALADYTLADIIKKTENDDTSGAHAWVMIRLQKEWYLIDPVNEIYMLHTSEMDDTYMLESADYISVMYEGMIPYRTGAYYENGKYFCMNMSGRVNSSSTLWTSINGVTHIFMTDENGDILTNQDYRNHNRIRPNGKFEYVQKIFVKDGKSYIYGASTAPQITSLTPDEVEMRFGVPRISVGTSFRVYNPEHWCDDHYCTLECDCTHEWSVTKLEFEDEEQFTNYPVTWDQSGNVTATAAGYVLVTSRMASFEFQIDPNYKAYFDANGGTCALESKKIYHGVTVGRMPTPEREGYSFLGWFTDNDEQLLPDSVIFPEEDLRLYAHWEQITQPEETPSPTPVPVEDGWLAESTTSFWYENGVRQGTYDDPKGVLGDGTVRGREIYDPVSDGWYWLDAVYDGAKAVNKEVWMPYIYQNEAEWDDAEIANNAANSGDMAEQVIREIKNRSGKWVRYDANGKMYKGWYTVEGDDVALYPDQAGNTYYYDPKTGLMAKGTVNIEGVEYYFDEITGVLQRN